MPCSEPIHDSQPAIKKCLSFGAWGSQPHMGELTIQQVQGTFAIRANSNLKE